MSKSGYRNSRADKQLQDKLQAVLSHLLREEDNKYCADCDAKGPRWASWNLGIFVCIRCAGIHRNLGVHISRVKSVNLDSWTDEQVGSMQYMGNSKGRAVYEASLPDSFRRPQNDSALETFIRAKYEHKKYIAREWVAPTKPMKTNFSVLATPSPAVRATEKKIDLNAVASSIPRPNSSGNIKEIASPGPQGQASPTQTSSSDDLFADFISAPLPVSVSVGPGDASSEEKDFFNQVAVSSQVSNSVGQSNSAAGAKIDKESILSLYSKTTQAQAPMQQLLTQGTVNPLVGAGATMAINTQIANNPFLIGGLVNSAQPAFNLGLTGQRQQPPTHPQIQHGSNLISSNLPAAKLGVTNGLAVPTAIQHTNVSMMNSQFAGLRLAASPAELGLPNSTVNSASNANSTLKKSNVWNF